MSRRPFSAKDQDADIYKLDIGWFLANTIELFSDTDQILEDGRYEHTMVAMGNKVYFPLRMGQKNMAFTVKVP